MFYFGLLFGTVRPTLSPEPAYIRHGIHYDKFNDTISCANAVWLPSVAAVCWRNAASEILIQDLEIIRYLIIHLVGL